MNVAALTYITAIVILYFLNMCGSDEWIVQTFIKKTIENNVTGI